MTNGGSLQWAAKDKEGTDKLAQSVAASAWPGMVIALDGDLGAGKTAFSQAFAAAIGVRGVVNSPTFTIIKEYEGEKLPFYHMDVYRLSAMEAADLGLDDYFYGAGVTIVEWASLIEELLPPQRLDIHIGHQGGQARQFHITGYGERYAQWCDNWSRTGALE